MGEFLRRHRVRIRIGILLGMGIPLQPLLAAQGPCDIYAAGGTPCVAAYSTVRSLSSKYTGPLYQVRRTSDGQTKDILADAGGYADGASQDAFLGTAAGTISKLYDQSGKANDLIKAPAGCYTGTASQPDNESNAKGRSLTVGGRKVYALYMVEQDGYRNNKTTGMATGSQAEGMYEIADGKRGGPACCWDFGNASTNNCNGGVGNMATIFFGTAYWGKGDGKGPWFMADLESGVWAGGAKAGDPGWGALSGDHPPNPKNPSMTMDYAFGVFKHNATNYAIATANAQSGALNIAYDGNVPSTLRWSLHGGIVLGIGGDNSNSSHGTFFEGAITSGRPTDSTDAAVLKNVQAAGYGSSVIAIGPGPRGGTGDGSRFRAHVESSRDRAVIGYSLQGSHRLALEIYDHQGKRLAELARGTAAAGSHEAAWDARGCPAGVYVATMTVDGGKAWSGKFFIGR